jgi:hypothetical protein
LHTTLVLEREAPDFSTDAGNSALIVETKSPLRLVAISGLPGGEEKNNNEIPSHHDWFHLEGTPCHGRSFLVDNSLLLPPCHPRR